jgi:hypothetical protein
MYRSTDSIYGVTVLTQFKFNSKGSIQMNKYVKSTDSNEYEY